MKNSLEERLKNHKFEALISAICLFGCVFIITIIIFICIFTKKPNRVNKRIEDRYFQDDSDLEECPMDIDPEEYKIDKKDLALAAKQNAAYFKAIEKVSNKVKHGC